MTLRSVRSTTLPALAGGLVLLGVWLVFGALPVFADGGPHVASANSGVATLTADGCAGCHRAHTAAGASLLVGDSDEDLCLTCHGAIATGATTDVADGNQYSGGLTQQRTATIAGALRGGGFVNARIDSSHTQRISYPGITGQSTTSFSALVPALAASVPSTSAHLAVTGSSVTAKNIAWANGLDNSGAGPSVTMGCTSCHNPHGNGYYRILNPVPAPDGSGFIAVTNNATVADAALPSGAGNIGVRNYTILWGRTLADVVSGTYPAGGVSPNGGDYWRKYLPWNGTPTATGPATGSFGDKPMYVPGGTNLTSFRAQITRWCAACHTRDDQITGAYTDSGDSIYRYRHDISRVECTQCHVAHGSNAVMSGTYSQAFPYPDDNPAGTRDLSASSRLLKVGNRGTCQMCHDPTHTIGSGNLVNAP